MCLALESRRRVKEQQQRCLKSEFGNTHFSYTLGLDGVEKFVATPELHSDDAIDGDPLPPGQVWASSPGTGDIRTIQELLGYSDVKTTMIYIHALNRGVVGVKSPADLLFSWQALRTRTAGKPWLRLGCYADRPSCLDGTAPSLRSLAVQSI